MIVFSSENACLSTTTWNCRGMGIDYEPTRIIDGVGTGKIRMARRFVSAMRGEPRHRTETMLELAAALEEVGRAEEAAKVREFADSLIAGAEEKLTQIDRRTGRRSTGSLGIPSVASTQRAGVQ
jgi:hypothetical protein